MLNLRSVNPVNCTKAIPQPSIGFENYLLACWCYVLMITADLAGPTLFAAACLLIFSLARNLNTAIWKHDSSCDGGTSLGN